MNRVIGLVAAMLIFFCADMGAAYNDRLGTYVHVQYFGHGQMGRAAGSIRVDAGSLVRPAVRRGLGSAEGSRITRHGLPGDPGESTAGNAAKGK